MSYQGAFQADNWHHGVASIALRNGIKTRRWGMRVTVYTGGSSGDYVLSYGLANTNIQSNANWLKVADIGQTWGGGGGGITTASNGLSVEPAGNVRWGDGDDPAILDNNVIIDGSNTYAVQFPNTAAFQVSGIGTYYLITSDDLMLFGDAGVAIESLNGDISLSSAGEWRINGDPGTAGYAITSQGPGLPPIWAPGGSGGTTADNGLTESSGNIQLGGLLVQNTNISGDNGLYNIIFSDLRDFQVSAGSGSYITMLGSAHGNNIEIITGTGGALSLTTAGGSQIAMLNSNDIEILPLGNLDIQSVSGGNITLATNFGGDITIIADQGGSFTANNNDLILQSPNNELNLFGNTVVVGSGSNVDLDIMTGHLAINGDPGTAGYVITSDGSGMPPYWAPAGGGGGITNSAANTELGMSNGTNIVPSGIFMPVVGQSLSFGSASIAGTDRLITSVGSGANISLTLASKGSSRVQIANNALNLGTTALAGGPRLVQVQSSSTNAGLQFISKGNGQFEFLHQSSGAGAGTVFTYGLDGVVVSNATTPTYQVTYKPDGISGINVSAQPTAFTIRSNAGIATTAPNAVLFEIVSGAGNNTDGNGGRIFIHTGTGAGAGVGGALDLEAAPGGAVSITSTHANITIAAGGAGYTIIGNLPTSSAGLPTGALWNNSGALYVA